MSKSNKIVLTIIFFGFIISVGLSLNNLKKYDKNVLDIDNYYHQMIKFDAYRYLSHGSEIKDQLKDGVNFFKTGREHYTKYLPPRVMAAYYYFFDLDLFNNNEDKLINTGIHFPYLLFQSIVYYFCIILFYFSILKKIKPSSAMFVVAFLSFEPTIMQYHSTFWSESLFFSIQILLIALILKKNQTTFNFFLIGFFLALLSLQKEYSIFYILPIIIFLLIFLEKKNIKNFLGLIVGFIMVQSILGFNNYYRSGDFYIMPATTKTDLHMLLVTNVMSKKFDIETGEFQSLEGKAVSRWINHNSIELKEKEDDRLLSSYNNPSLWTYRDYIKNEPDKIRFDEFIQKRTISYFKKYPIDFVSEIFKRSVHTVLLNPFHIYSDHNFKSGEVYYLTKKHDELIPYRVVYAMIIYLICLIGLYSLIKEKNYMILLFLILSITYFFAPICWHGNTRYFLPCFIYFSFFFGLGIDKLINYRKIQDN